MGHLGGIFLLMAPLFCLLVCGAAGHSLPACHNRLEFRCGEGSCISRSKVCDGHSDCEDGSDEGHCTHVWCKKDEFACHSRRCISVKSLCDGVDDCGDGSDEDSCHNCTAGFFLCGPSDACLSENKLCDGRKDCQNGHDESRELCGSVQPLPQRSKSSCAASEFRCRDGACIRHAWRCDHSPDCSDGSDEADCDIFDQNECLVDNGGCSHHCVDQPIGFLCSCPDNMKLVDDSRCEEVDVCLESDVCEQLCVHTNRSLACKCLEGYRMNPATGECRANGEAAQLVFTTSKKIRMKNLISSSLTELTPHSLDPGPVAPMASSRTLFWAPKGRGSIYRMSIDEKPQEANLVLKVQTSISGLVVDWIHGLLYWTSPDRGSVNVALLDGSSQRLLISGLQKPSAVAVEPLQGFLFWAQCGNTPMIERAGLDGHNRMVLVSSLIKQPAALSLDVPRKLLYWFDQGARSISRVTFDGRHRKTVVESNGYLDQLFGLAVFEGFLYWGDEFTHSICRANKRSGKNLQVLLFNVTSPGGLAIIHPVLQPIAPSSCGRPKMTCQHECVVNLQPKRVRFSCKAPETETPVISRTVPASALSQTTFAGILSLIIVLSVLLVVGMAFWWWREALRPSRQFTFQSFSLKESQDPLIVQEPPLDPDTVLIKETLLKLDLDSD